MPYPFLTAFIHDSKRQRTGRKIFTRHSMDNDANIKNINQMVRSIMIIMKEYILENKRKKIEDRKNRIELEKDKIHSINDKINDEDIQKHEGVAKSKKDLKNLFEN
jgi:hypothetical protein